MILNDISQEGLLEGLFNFMSATCVSAIHTAFSILQSGVIDRENKSELKKLREAMERLEGEPSGVIDI